MEFFLLLGVFALGSFIYTQLDDDEDSSAPEVEEPEITPDLPGDPSDPEEPEDEFSFDDTIVGTDLADTLVGTPLDEIIDGGNGADTINGSGGHDGILGGSGADVIDGDSGHDIIIGESGNDTIDGAGGNDLITGSSGDDEVDGNEGNDFVLGGSGDDNVHGGEGNDILDGETGSDTIRGGAGDDLIIGYFEDDQEAFDAMAPDETDADTIRGGTGDDFILLGSGDKASGEEGADEFRTGIWVNGTDVPVIKDYDDSEDVISVVAPEDAPGVVTIAEASTAGDAQVFVDGVMVALVKDAYGTLEAADVNVVVEYTPLEATA
ncbi:MAG: calcium-binding protein [Cognatishimia sp.]